MCEEAFETFKANARPGVTLGGVSRKTLGVIEQAGYDWVKEPLAWPTRSVSLNKSRRSAACSPARTPDFELMENHQIRPGRPRSETRPCRAESGQRRIPRC